MTRDPARGALPERRRILAAWLGGAPQTPSWEALAEELPPDLLPFAHHRLTRDGRRAQAPKDLDRALARAARSNAALQLGHRAELRSAVRALEAGGIPSLVLKGMALAHGTYPAPETRVMVDVDLGVPLEHLARARSILEGTGLRVPERRARDVAEAVGAWEGPLERPGTSRMVDLHGSIKVAQPPYATRVQKEALDAGHWARGSTLAIAGFEAQALGPDDALRHTILHLACMHGFQHGLRSLLDVALLVKQHAAAIEWDALRHSTGALGPWVGLTLALVAEDLGAPLEAALIESFAPNGIPEEAKGLAREQLWSSHEVHAPVGLLDVLARERGVLRPALDADRTVGGGGRRAGLDDVRRRLVVLGKNLRRGQLRPTRIARGVALRRAHWRLADLMRSDI